MFYRASASHQRQTFGFSVTSFNKTYTRNSMSAISGSALLTLCNYLDWLNDCVRTLFSVQLNIRGGCYNPLTLSLKDHCSGYSFVRYCESSLEDSLGPRGSCASSRESKPLSSAKQPLMRLGAGPPGERRSLFALEIPARDLGDRQMDETSDLRRLSSTIS